MIASRNRKSTRNVHKRKAVGEVRIDWGGGRNEARRLHAEIDGVVEGFERVDQECSDATSEGAATIHRHRLELLDASIFAVEHHMNGVRDSLLEKNMLFVDTEYDGSCGIHAVLPAFSNALGRPTSKQEVRELVINELSAPAFRADLEADLRNTNRVRRGDRPLASVDELLNELAEADRFVPPELLYKATEAYTRGRIRLWAYDSDKGAIPLLWSDGEEGVPFSCEIVHIPAASASSSRHFAPHDEQVGGHIARVLPLASPRRAQMTFARALGRLSDEEQRNKRMRLALAAQ